MIKLVMMGKLGPLLPPAWERVELPADVRNLADLRAWLGRELPDLDEELAAKSVKVAVNLSVVHDMTAPVRAGDEIAFLPPMSGG